MNNTRSNPDYIKMTEQGLMYLDERMIAQPLLPTIRLETSHPKVNQRNHANSKLWDRDKNRKKNKAARKARKRK